MARWLVTKKCVWNGRAWDPGSSLDKDMVYSGEKTPPKGLFKKLGDKESVPSNAPKAPAPIAFSTIQKRAARDPQVLAHNASMDPVVDGQSVKEDAPEAGFLQ